MYVRLWVRVCVCVCLWLRVWGECGCVFVRRGYVQMCGWVLVLVRVWVRVCMNVGAWVGSCV